MNNLTKLLENLDQLATLPTVVARLAALIKDPQSDINDIVQVIAYDQALTANLIRWANSAVWAQRKPIVDVKEAVIRLGPGRIFQIVVGSHLKRPMESACAEYGLNEGELWKHAIASSLACEELGSHCASELPPEAITAALLHDVGKLVLKQLIDPKTLQAIVDLSNSPGVTYVQAEFELLGFAHPEVGSEMANRWHFPETVIAAIFNHHNPDGAVDLVTDAVHVSNIAAKTVGIGLGNEAMNLSGSEKSAQRLGIARKHFEHICMSVLEKLPGLEQLYQL
jgi:putative nucleotidyltransferase with HDIG domain